MKVQCQNGKSNYKELPFPKNRTLPREATTLNGQHSWSLNMLSHYKEMVRLNEIQNSLKVAHESNLKRLVFTPPTKTITHKFFFTRSGEWMNYDVTTPNPAFLAIQMRN
eukprot:PhF_6_TR11892/c0_g1_i1/m.19309